MAERWLPVVGYEGLYEVSDQGRVRSLARAVWVRPCARFPKGHYRQQRGAMLSLALQNGYPCVALCRDGDKPLRRVHHLVLEAFIGPCPAGAIALHRDGSRTNNTAPNLRWGSHAENAADAIAHGVVARGTDNANSKLDDETVRHVRALSKTTSQTAISKLVGLHQTTISQIVRGVTWRHVA